MCLYHKHDRYVTTLDRNSIDTYNSSNTSWNPNLNLSPLATYRKVKKTEKNNNVPVLETSLHRLE